MKKRVIIFLLLLIFICISLIGIFFFIKIFDLSKLKNYDEYSNVNENVVDTSIDRILIENQSESNEKQESQIQSDNLDNNFDNLEINNTKKEIIENSNSNKLEENISKEDNADKTKNTNEIEKNISKDNNFETNISKDNNTNEANNSTKTGESISQENNKDISKEDNTNKAKNINEIEKNISKDNNFETNISKDNNTNKANNNSTTTGETIPQENNNNDNLNVNKKWCYQGGNSHIRGTGKNEHGFYKTKEEALNEAKKAMKNYESGNYKIDQCLCNLFYFYIVED